MLKFLKDIHEALDKSSSDTVVAFYNDFGKAFDRVPHYEQLENESVIGVGGCSLDIFLTTRTDEPSTLELGTLYRTS